MTTITRAGLDKYLNQKTSDFCGAGFHDNDQNHCAHFVSHVLDYRFSYCCFGQSKLRKMPSGGSSVCIRVNEIFTRCPTVGKWDDRPATLSACLVFAVKGATNVNVANKYMEPIPSKHVGIYCDGNIWHFSNTNHYVVKTKPDNFSHHYGKGLTALFYGELI